MQGADPLPGYLSSKSLPRSFSSSWPFIVVSGHVKTPGQRNLVGPNRIAFHSGTCQGESLRFSLFAPDIIATGTLPEAIWSEVTEEGARLLPDTKLLKYS